jgi:hypothetical protein
MDCGFPEQHWATGVRLRRSCRIADWEQTCSGTATVRLAASGPRRAKCTNKPNRETERRAHGAALLWLALLGPSVRNKANLPRIDPRPPAAGAAGGALAGTNRAEQSQFLWEHQKRQAPCGKGVMMNWTGERGRKNKANFGPAGHGQGAARLPAPPVRLVAQNKANSSLRTPDRRAPEETPSEPSFGSIAPNKPNRQPPTERGAGG